MTHALRLPLADPAALAALAAQLRVWLLGVLAWLLDVTGAERRLPRALWQDLAAEIAGARDEVLELVCAHVRLTLRPQRRTRVRCAIPADLHRSRISARRAFERHLIARPRSLSARIRVLIAALDGMEALVRRAIVRIAKGWKGAWIVFVTPAAPFDAIAPAMAFADSS